MKVILAGYNVDADVIEDLKRHAPPRNDVTPETLSAAYARISRHPRPVDELRAAARREVERARKSNQNIIFKMGHHSVAEHAVFNFDVVGVSRLAVEEIEKFRFCSFTEKSQRYNTLTDDFVIPEEIRKAGKENLFAGTVRAQNAAYRRFYEKLRPFFRDNNPGTAGKTNGPDILDGWAKEDARYVVSLAAHSQLGMTVNARSLELMIRRFASKNLAEIRELRSKLHDLVKDVAPSLMRFTAASEHDRRTPEALRDQAIDLWGEKALRPRKMPKTAKSVRLVDATSGADDKLLAALVHSVTLLDFEAAMSLVVSLRSREKKNLVKRVFQRMEFYDVPPREFEYVDLTFDLVISAACFAQLKRHRTATLTTQDYDPALGVTIPPSIEQAGLKSEFMEMMDRTNDVYEALRKDAGEAAAYVLTNAHRRRALLKVNARELYHISRLRQDATAQWDIRRIAAEMSRQARKSMPLTGLLLGGKDAYPKLYQKIFGRPPKSLPPSFGH